MSIGTIGYESDITRVKHYTSRYARLGKYLEAEEIGEKVPVGEDAVG